MKLLNDKETMTESTELVTADDAWQRVPASKRLVATDRGKLVMEVIRIMNSVVSQRSAIELFLMRIDLEDYIDPTIIQLAKKLGRKGRLSYSTLNRWVNGYNKNGLFGLLPNHQGSGQKVYGWEVRATRLYSLPSKPSISAVTRKLIAEDFADVTEARVRRYIKSLPSDKGEMSRGRLGPRLFVNTQKSFVRRSTENLPVGTCYQGDGHTLDLYLQHPSGKKPWRAELTLWLDVTSRYVVGWYLSEAESGNSTLFALSYAILSHDHIPAVLHIDNGSGYKNKMMSDDSTGFYSRLGITVMHSRPYNAKGKGHVERFFGTMERDFNKWFESYCGADMADEAIQALLKKHKKGEITFPTAEQWIVEFNRWLEQYHNTPHGGLNKKTPAEVWATLERHPVEIKSTAIFWPQRVCMVRREAITFDKREYMAPELIQYNGKKLTIEYNLHDDRAVRVLDDKGRWICDAPLVNKADYLPASRIIEAKQKRAEQSVKRLGVHMQEQIDRSGLAITHDQNVDELLDFNADKLLDTKKGATLTEAAPDTSISDSDDAELDIFDTDY